MKTYTTFIADCGEYKEVVLTEEQLKTLPRIKRPYTSVVPSEDITIVWCEELIETPDGLALVSHQIIGYVYGMPVSPEELEDEVLAECDKSYRAAIQYQFDRFIECGETFLTETFIQED